MKASIPLNAAEERAWRALGVVEDHPQVERWLADADKLVLSEEHRRTKRWHRWPAALAAGVAGAAIAVTLGVYLHFAPDRYQTALGEQRDVTFPDGSRVTLNTDTSITVRYSASRRYIVMERGEALFAVKADRARPFEVEAGGAVARALGTEFNVDLRGPKVTVSVLDGAVGVAAAEQIRSPGLLQAMGQAHEPEATASMAALSKGQAVEFRKKDGRMKERKADLQRINAWRTRRLEFSNTPLPEAIAEVNRYSSTHVVVGSPELAEVRVSGVFRIGDADGFLYSLREALKLETLESSGEVVVMKRAE